MYRAESSGWSLRIQPLTREIAMPQLAVMEPAEWYDDDQITSIKSVLHILSQLENFDPNDFVHSTFVNEASFKATLHYLTGLRQTNYIYIGCHATPWMDDKLETPAGDCISRTEILNRVNKRHIRGVFLSVCNSNNIAKYIAENVGYNTWVAGYGKEVNWIQSCAFEMLFWQRIFRVERKQHRKRRTVRKVVNRLGSYRGLFDKLQLELWGRSTNGNIENLLRPG